MSDTLGVADVLVKVPMAGVKSAFAKMKGMFSELSSQALALSAGATIAAGGLAVGLIKMGSDANEAASKLDAVFGDQASSVRSWADDYAKHIGRSKQEVRSFTTDMAALIKPMGFATGDAKKLGEQMTALAYDLGSFHNVSDTDALAALRSGLSGEAEPLKKFGILLNETSLNAQLLKMGITGGTQAASEQQKVLARSAVIMEATKDAQGDAFRTSTGVANSWKALTGEAMDLGAELGTSLLPLAQELIGVFRMAIASLGGVGGAFTAVGGAGTGALSTLVDWIKSVVLALSNWDLSAKVIGVSMAESFTNMWGRVKWFGEQAVILGGWLFDNWKTVALDIANVFITSFKNLFSNIVEIIKNLPGLISGSISWGDVWKPMLAGFEATTKEMPKFTDFVAADFSQQYKELDKEWDARMKKISTPKAAENLAADVNDPYQDLGITADGSGGKKKKGKEGGSMTDIASIWKQAQEGLGKAQENKVQEDMLKANKEMVVEQKRANAMQEAANKKPALVVPT